MSSFIRTIDDLNKLYGIAPYHPDDSDSICLTDELVQQILQETPVHNQLEQQVIDFICLHEKLHRKVLYGQIAKENADKIIDKLSDDFGKQYDAWIHLEDIYNRFYLIINGGKWRQ